MTQTNDDSRDKGVPGEAEDKERGARRPIHRPLTLEVSPAIKHMLELNKGLAGISDALSQARFREQMMPALLASQQMLASRNGELVRALKGPDLSGLIFSNTRLQLALKQSALIAGPMLSAYQLQTMLLAHPALSDAQNATKALASFRVVLRPLAIMTGAAESLYGRAESDVTLFDRLKVTAQVPAAYVYAATRAVSIAVDDDNANDSDLEDSEDQDTESSLDAWSADLPSRLARLNRDLERPLLGMRAALKTQQHDWVRAFSASGRQLLESLLDMLATEEALSKHFTASLTAMSVQERKKLFDNGQWTRRAQLRFILREISDGDFQRMSDNMIDICLSLFFPTNAGVHTLKPTLTDLQARALMHQLEASVQMILLVATR